MGVLSSQHGHDAAHDRDAGRDAGRAREAAERAGSARPRVGRAVPRESSGPYGSEGDRDVDRLRRTVERAGFDPSEPRDAPADTPGDGRRRKTILYPKPGRKLE